MKKTAGIIIFVWIFFSFWAFSKSEVYQLEKSLGGISFSHPFGFDTFGRDVVRLVFRSSALSAFFAALTVISSTFLSILLGNTIALSTPRIRFAMLRGLESFLAFPSLLFALAWAALRGPGWDTLLFALLMGSVPSFVRLIYARSQELLEEPFIEAAKSSGAGRWRIMIKHLIPFQLSLCRVKAPGLFAHALMAEATLTFLGVGAPIGSDTWGSLLIQGKTYLIEAPHIAIGTGIPLLILIMAFQSFSDEISKKTISQH